VATITWPASLPQSLIGAGYTENIADNRIVDQFETGPVAVRRRATSAPFPVVGRMIMTTAQWETFRTFCETTLTHLVLPFGLPEHGVALPGEWLVRFTEPPSRTYLGSGNWMVSLSLEVLP
jgi:hypothetical protein